MWILFINLNFIWFNHKLNLQTNPMTEARLIDGLTGELIGGQPSLYGAQQTGAQYNSNLYQTSSNVHTGYNTQYVGATNQSTYVQQGPQIVNTVVNTGKEVIKGESRIEYVPFEKKVIEYKDEVRVERVPKTRKVVEYREEKRIETVPREVTKTDYYAVEYLRQYIPQYVPEKTIEYVARERKIKKYEYIPVERQIVHYPEQPLEAELHAGQYQTGYVQGGITTGSYVQGQTQYVTGGQSQYVTGGHHITGGYPVSGQGQSAIYQTGYQQPVQGEYRQVETTQYVPQGYQQTTYVTGGSGVGQQQGGYTTQQGYSTTQQGYTTGGQTTYVTGGSGVRGSGVRQTTNLGYWFCLVFHFGIFLFEFKQDQLNKEINSYCWSINGSIDIEAFLMLNKIR